MKASISPKSNMLKFISFEKHILGNNVKAHILVYVTLTCFLLKRKQNDNLLK